MKKVLIIILAFLLAVDGALLVYGGIFMGEEASLGFEDKPLTKPVDPDVYAHAISEWIVANKDENPTFWPATNPSKNPEKFAAEVDGWYDVFGKIDPSTNILLRHSGADLVPYLLLPVTYNHNRAKQYCLNYHYEIRSAGGNIVTDGMRIKHQPVAAQYDCYYLAFVWSGVSGRVTLKVEFNTQRLKSNPGTSKVRNYDKKTHSYDYTLAYLKPNTPFIGYESTREDCDIEREVPYKLYEMLCVPIHVGDGMRPQGDISKEEQNERDRHITIDSSVIDGSTVAWTAPSEENPYYTLTFSEDPNTAQCKENVEDCLNDALGGMMKNITIKKADFVAEIWESGLFRQASVHFLVNAKINGKQGDATIDMTYKFYYDDDSCDIGKYILRDGWDKYLNAENKALLEASRK